MPRVYTTTFPVHHYDLGAFGELRASSYVRLLQQAATEASEDAGFPDAWYVDAGTFWLIRRTTIEYRHPVKASDRLRVRTWVADFRRVRSQREYEVLLDGSSHVAARAHTDWVYVDRATARPRRVPPEIMDRLVPDGGEPPLPRAPWACTGAPSEAFSMVRTVEFRDLDALDHVNNATYLDFVEDAALAASAAAGWPLARVRSLGGYWRSRSHDIEYLAEAHYGDALQCVCWVRSCTGSTIERSTEIRRTGDDALLARARSRWAWISTATREPAEVPVVLAAVLR
jgi:acyl-CoA thioester hydrolase